MSHHGREYEDDREVCGAECTENAVLLRRVRGQLQDAVDLLCALACGENVKAEEIRAVTSFCQTNGFDTPGNWRDKQRRKARAAEIDAEIERLRAERAKL